MRPRPSAWRRPRVRSRVQLLDPEGGFLDVFRGESGVSKWGDDYFVSNQDELEERRKADMEPELDLSPRDFYREE